MAAKVRNIVITLLAIGLGILSTIFLPTGQPHVEVKAEPLFYLFPNFPFTNSLLVTLIVDVLLVVVTLAATGKMNMVPRGLQNIMELTVESLYNLYRGINRVHVDAVFPIVATIFFFVLFSNWIGLLPGFGSIGMCEPASAEPSAIVRPFEPASAFAAEPEGTTTTPAATGSRGCKPGEVLVPFFRTPSADLNMTLALAIISFFLIEFMAFKTLGFGYLKKFFNFSSVMGFFIGLLELVSELGRLPAFMFRLFGNVFAGEVILLVLSYLVPLFLPIPLYAFEVFVGFIQAIIFSVLTMAFINLAVMGHGDHDEAHAH